MVHPFRKHGFTLDVFSLEDGEGPGLHKHSYKHTIFVARGSVLLLGVNQILDAPAEKEFVAGTEHGFIAKGGPATVVSIFVTDDSCI